LVVSVLCPWPWPGSQGLPPVTLDDPLPAIPPGLYPWPVWDDLPSWLAPGTWTLGLATGLAGAFAGTVVLRGVRFLFGIGRGLLGSLAVFGGVFLLAAGFILRWLRGAPAE